MGLTVLTIFVWFLDCCFSPTLGRRVNDFWSKLSLLLYEKNRWRNHSTSLLILHYILQLQIKIMDLQLINCVCVCVRFFWLFFVRRIRVALTLSTTNTIQIHTTHAKRIIKSYIIRDSSMEFTVGPFFSVIFSACLQRCDWKQNKNTKYCIRYKQINI